MKNYLFLFALVLGCSLVVSAQEISDWIAPEYTKSLKNPIEQESFEESIEEGKYFFMRHCISCHGKKGKGNGEKAKKFNPRPANLTVQSVQNQEDGEIFWKIAHGRNKMLSFKKILTEEYRWFLVNYIRTLVE